MSLPLCLYCDGDENETVAGSINLAMKKGKKIEHVGIRVQLIGQIGQSVPLQLSAVSELVVLWWYRGGGTGTF